MKSANQHVRDYLDYYVSLSRPPHYAVMINGPWGVGKTHFIRGYLASRFKPEENKHLYVSLYGLKTREDIDNAIAQAAYPALGWTVTKVGARLAKSVLKGLTNVEPDFNISDLGKIAPEVIVFDDLERCELDLNATMGYINEFVEHNDGKVIILANEKDIDPDKRYDKRREKVIGKTLALKSDFSGAFQYFLTLLENKPTIVFLRKHERELSAVYYQSELDNFRILQQSMWDFERIFSILTEKHRSNHAAMVELLQFFFALSFDFRSGRLNEEDLKTRIIGLDQLFYEGFAQERDGKKAKVTPMEQTFGRYRGINIYSNLISNDLLPTVLADGLIDADAITHSISKSDIFSSREDETPWRTLWHWYERSAEHFNEALATIRAGLKEGSIRDVGELGHILAMLIYFAKEGVTGEKVVDVVKYARSYLDKLYSGETTEDMRNQGRIVDTSYGGLGIHRSDEYSKLREYWKKLAAKALDNSYPEQAQKLLEIMERDPPKFFTMTNITNDGTPNVYARIPILSYLDPKLFVETVLRQPEHAQKYIFMSLKGRYEEGMLERQLRQEEAWILKVRGLFKNYGSKQVGIDAFRIRKFLEWNLTDIPATTKKSKKAKVQVRRA